MLYYTIAIPAILGWLRYRSRPELREFTFYLTVGVPFVAGYNIGLGNHLLDDYLVAFEGGFVALTLAKIIRLKLRPIFFGILFFELAMILFAIILPEYDINETIEGLGLTLLSAWALLKIFTEEIEHSLFKDSRFWLSAATLMFFCVMVFLELLNMTLATSKDYDHMKYYGYFLLTNNLISYFLYCVAYLCPYPMMRS